MNLIFFPFISCSGQAYTKLQDQSAVKALIPRIQYYNDMLTVFGLRDHQVENTTSRAPYFVGSIPLLLKKTSVLLVSICFFVGSVFINFPIIVVARSYSRRKAKGSNLSLIFAVSVSLSLRETILLISGLPLWQKRSPPLL